MNSTNPVGPIALFWQVFPCSGIARFDTIAQASSAADDLLTRCPDATISREYPNPIWHGPLTESQDAYARKYGWTVADMADLFSAYVPCGSSSWPLGR